MSRKTQMGRRRSPVGSERCQLVGQLRRLKSEVSYLRIGGGWRRKPGGEGGHNLRERRHLFKNEIHAGVQR